MKQFHIRVNARVTPVFQANPKDRFYLSTKEGRPLAQTVELVNNLDSPTEVVDLDHTLGDQVEVAWKTVEPGRRYEVTLSTTADQPMRRGGRVNLRLKDAALNIWSMSAYVQVNPNPRAKAPDPAADKEKSGN
jgi:hypothetical protein